MPKRPREGNGIEVWFVDDMNASIVKMGQARILFIFEHNSKTVGYAVDPEKAIGPLFKALCLASYLECLKDCDNECLKDGLDAECRIAYKDCATNFDTFKEHITQLYKKSGMGKR